MQWLKLPAWTVADCGFVTRSGIQVLKKRNASSTLTRKDSILWRASVTETGGGPRVVVSTAAFHARVRGSVPGLGGFKETKAVSSPSTCESLYCAEPP